MSEPRSLAVQSVIYHNSAANIIRAAESLANSVRYAMNLRLICDWTLDLGDCSSEPMLDAGQIKQVAAVTSVAGGSLNYTFFEANLGSAAGHNALASNSVSDLILILNPDALAAPEMVTALARALIDNVGIAEARQVPLEHPKTFKKGTGDTSWASTAGALTLRSAFERVGGFDAETFFLYCDDVDYSWQLRLAGYRVVYEPGARLFHDKRLTTEGDWPASEAEVYYSAEAALFLTHKYSRPDLTNSLLRSYRQQNQAPLTKAVDEYLGRKKSGRLPRPVDNAHRVGEFIQGNYAAHRY